jgi:hypothetical protein
MTNHVYEHRHNWWGEESSAAPAKPPCSRRQRATLARAVRSEMRRGKRTPRPPLLGDLIGRSD